MTGTDDCSPRASSRCSACCRFRVHGQVTPQRLAAAASEPQNWLTYSGNYSSKRYSPLDQITPANVKNLKLQWVYQAPVAGNWQTTPLVVDGMMYITQRPNDVVALDADDRPRVLDLSLHPGRRSHRLLRREQPRRRDPRRHAVHGHARRAADRDRRQDRAAAVEDRGREHQVRLLDHARAAGREGQGDRRRRRRRVRHPRLHRRLRRRRPARKRGASTPFPAPASPGTRRGSAARRSPTDVLRSRGLEARRRIDLDDRLLRSAAQSHLLGRRQRRSRLQRRAAARRQPLHRLGRRARRRHRQAEVALPVHAARRLRLRLGAGAGARRQLGGQPRQRRRVGQPQRQLLRRSIARRDGSCSASRS